jgi:hypothetical protein
MSTINGNVKVFKAINDFYKVYKSVDVPKLKGVGHVDRVMVLPGLAKYIPDELKDTLLFEGQGRLPIIPKLLAQQIANNLEVDLTIFCVEV